jgi:hypothetical protein
MTLEEAFAIFLGMFLVTCLEPLMFLIYSYIDNGKTKKDDDRGIRQENRGTRKRG